MIVETDKETARQVALGLFSDERPPMAVFAPEVKAWLPAPFGRVSGAEALGARFYRPLLEAFGTTRIGPELLLADRFGGATWVAAMGALRSDQGAPFLGIPPGRGRVLRFGLFLRFAGARIDEMRVLFDLPQLAAQAGIDLLPPFAGRPEVETPDPALALNLGPKPPAESGTSRDLVAALIGGLNQLKAGRLASMPQRDFWDVEMRWYGPWGIGACHGFREYQEFAQGPSVASFPDRRGTWPKDAFVAEGQVAAFTGWPSLVGTFSGAPFRGIPPTGGPIGQTIMDFYLRRGERLYQNWVFIDLIDFAAQCGVDLMAPLRAAPPR